MNSFEQFIKYQIDKHESWKQFEANFLVTMLKLGKPLIDNIQKFSMLYIYKEGQNIYFIFFMEQLNAYFGIKTHVIFVEDKIIKGCFHLMSIIFLYNSNLIVINYDIIEECERIMETSYFMIKDLTQWLKSKLLKEVKSKKLLKEIKRKM